MQCTKSYACHGGIVSYYAHQSDVTHTMMHYSLFLPEHAKSEMVPYLIFLSGLTCTEDNFPTKAGAYKKAAELGMAILVPDTSPRGDNVPDDEAYDLGQGAGFYLNATQAPWAKNFQMESYLIKELLPMVERQHGLDKNYRFICGHSMGGHGALTLYMKYPAYFRSCSAFAPIVAPCQAPWGQKMFRAYLGSDENEWQKHDACALMMMQENAVLKPPIFIDQGLDDQFLHDQLKPHLFEEACNAVGQALTLRTHANYDHSYFFIQSFIDDHLTWHHEGVKPAN